MMPVSANEVREALDRHKENHAMLLLLLRRVTRTMDEQQHHQFAEEFVEIAEAIRRHRHAVQGLVEASIDNGILPEQRNGKERRQPWDRRWRK